MALVTVVLLPVGNSSCAPASAPASAAFCTSRRWKYSRPASRPRAMIPNSAVAESATITRLCARLPLRSLISICSILRHHRGLRRDHNAVAGRIPHDRDPRLEEERDLDRDLAPARGSNARAVPDVAGIRLGRRRRRGRAARKAGIRRQRTATAELALHRRDDGRVGVERRVKRDRGPGALTGGVGDRVVDVHGTSQVDGAEQQQEEHGREHGKLDHRLAAEAAQQTLAHQYSALNTALELIVTGFPTRLPMIGVMKLNWKLAETVIAYCVVGVAPVK